MVILAHRDDNKGLCVKKKGVMVLQTLKYLPRHICLFILDIKQGFMNSCVSNLTGMELEKKKKEKTRERETGSMCW